MTGSRGCLLQLKETVKSRIETTNIGTADEKGYNDDVGLRVVPAVLPNAHFGKVQRRKDLLQFWNSAASDLRVVHWRVLLPSYAAMVRLSSMWSIIS
ncbi:hypothetical protein ARMGADRAFT_356638 [Armillaria gallica]|uniref:Uncharacterized protein n=1 Tax=Armillaria gallica TaxID=47427 RepID=A0A2H3D0I5_ARMGA|nr:hypothetical protein ARMGADRAFT_356638 [Armillaria gallica]